LHICRRFPIRFFEHDAKLFASCPPWPHTLILLHTVNRALDDDAIA